MDSISPLAKILAEANGIDWRSLQGSGAGGSVVEQDILNYLSRIMSGDEEPPATPVDEAPPGWTGEMPPMPVAISGLEALSAAGVESDITDFVAQQSQAAQTLSTQTSPAQTLPAQASSAQTVPDQTLPVQPVLSELAPAQSAFSAPEFGSVTTMPARRNTPGDDLEFELDDLDDDSAAADLSTDYLSTDDLTAGSGPDPVSPPAAETVHTEPVQTEPVQLQQPAYDPVALDADADFVMADRLPGLPTTLPEPEAALPPPMAEYAVVSQPAEHEQPAQNSQPSEGVQPEYGRPAGKEQPAATVEAASSAAGTSGFGLGGFLSRLYGGKAKAEAEAAPATTIPATTPALSSAESASPLAASDFAAPDLHGPNLGEALIPLAPAVADTPVAAPLVADQWRDQELTGPELPALELTEMHHSELGQPTDLPEDHEVNQHEASQEASGELQLPTDQQAMSEDGSDAATPRPAPEAPMPEVSFLEQPVSEPFSSEQHGTEQPADRSPSWTDAALPLGVAAGVGATGLAITGLAAAPDAQDLGAPQSAPAEFSDPVTAATVSALSPASSAAMTLRLNLDLHALETARAQLSTALVRDVPLGLLVARAAARSLSTLGLHTSEGTAEGVALANHAGQPLATDLKAEFRASLEGLGHVAQAQPALLVLDASALGLDELHRGECSLSVGRTSSDGAVLSLRGELDPARGAQFLHEVAGLLGTPILLLF